MGDSTSADAGTEAPAPTGLPALIGRLLRLKPVRVFLQFASRSGPIMASGLTYQGLFAVFAAVWVSFSIAGLVLADDLILRTELIAQLRQSVPGLIDDGSGSGVIDPDVLLETGTLSWTGAIALAGLLFTALGWLASARDSVRAQFGLTPLITNLLLLKGKDLGIAVVLGGALIFSALLSATSTALLGVFLDAVGIGSDSLTATIVGRIVGLVVTLAFDTFVLAALYRVLAGVPIPLRHLVGGAVLGGVAVGTLKVLGGALLGGAGSNPLLASFAVIVGVLLVLNLLCQVLLICAAWIAVGMEDRGISADPKAEAARLEKERLEKETAQREAAEAARPRGIRRLFARRRSS